MGSPHFDRPFILDVDASDYALGAELSQEDDNGDERPVYYGSRHLEKAERSYSATARETLAAVFGCEYFSQYLQGRKFILRSDHNPLVWLRSMKNPKRPYNGWIIRLEQFQYEIKYRPGRLHENADFNSRVRPTEEMLGQRSVSTQTGVLSEEVNMDEGAQKLTSDEAAEVEPSEHNIATITKRDGKRKIATITKRVNMDEGVQKFTSDEAAKVEPSEQNSATVTKRDGKRKIAAIVRDEEENRVNEDNLEGEEELLDEDVEIEAHDIENEDALSGEFLSRQQGRDEDIGPVMRRLQDPGGSVELTPRGERLWKLRASLLIQDGVLMRHYRFGAGREPIEQVVLPNAMKDLAMESMHDNMFAGHFGVKKTLTRVKLRYYWPGYMKDVEDWCRTCLVCQRRKHPPSKNVAPLQSINTGQGPFEQVALDIVKLPRTSRGNQYALVVEDYFSKWVEAFPLSRTVAPSVAQCIVNGWIARFGCPYTILSDQGSEFESELFKCVNETLEIHKLRTTTYHPRTDGMVERSNRTLIDVLSKYANTEPDWDLRLPLVL